MSSFPEHIVLSFWKLLPAGCLHDWNDQASFQMLTIDGLLFLTCLVAEQELADLKRWKEQNRAKLVRVVPQRLGEWQKGSQSG